MLPDKLMVHNSPRSKQGLSWTLAEEPGIYFEANVKNEQFKTLEKNEEKPGRKQNIRAGWSGLIIQRETATPAAIYHIYHVCSYTGK